MAVSPFFKWRNILTRRVIRQDNQDKQDVEGRLGMPFGKRVARTYFFNSEFDDFIMT